MVLNDVGAIWDYEINDVSRGWPCNGKFTDKQKLLCQCAYNTSEYMSQTLKPGMVFCVDVGICHEEWGIGFRLEDNCLITETGCENLTKDIPKTTEEIEDFMS